MLHSILKFLNTPDTKIWTAEGPVIVTQKGLWQVQVNKKAGIDFGPVMHGFFAGGTRRYRSWRVARQRNGVDGRGGITIWLYGVFSAASNSASESIKCLLDMGTDPFNFVDALLGILAQRLVKKAR